MDELAAWILFPLIALVLCAGVGRLAAYATRSELPGALEPAVGLAVSIALLAPLFATGAHAWVGLVLLAAFALGGFVLRRSPAGLSAGARRRRAVPLPGFGALAGVATYALHIAPVALTGRATFLGYNLLNDTSIHLALVDWIGGHGSTFTQQPPSSYGAAINDYVGHGYPLGAHELLAVLREPVGLDAAQVYQPFLAFCAAVAAAALFEVLRGGAARQAPHGVGARAGGPGARDGAVAEAPHLPARAAAVGAFAALAGQLVFSFALQGSIKELAFIACLAAAAGAVRRPLLLAVVAASLYAIYGVSALAWIAPLAIVACVVNRPSLRLAATAAGLFVLAIAAQISTSIAFYQRGESTLTSNVELGPLAGPLKPLQVAGIWLNGDYRFTPQRSLVTYLLAVALVVVAISGLIMAIRRRHAPLLTFVLVPLVAALATAPSASPYIQAKLLAVLSPAVVLAAAFALGVLAEARPGAPTLRGRGGPAGRSMRRLALAASVVLGGALLVSDALAYRMALPAPAERLAELEAIDDQLAGRGPVLVNEYEEYVKHYMRRSRGSDPYESWTAARAGLRNRRLPVGAHEYDLDQMRTSFITRWPYIVLRRSPTGSRPPANYTRIGSYRFYEVWKRSDTKLIAHVALGKPPLDPTGPLDCKLARRLAAPGRTVVASIRSRPLLVSLSRARPLPPGWYRYGQDPSMLEIHKGGRLALPQAPTSVTTGAGPPSVSYWIRGRTTRKSTLEAGGTTLPVPRMLQRTTDWIPLGPAPLRAAPLSLEREKRSLRPGDAQPDIVGPIAAVSNDQKLVSGRALQQACGQPADWIDVLAR